MWQPCSSTEFYQLGNSSVSHFEDLFLLEMDFLRNYFVVLLALILVFVLNVSFTLGDYKIEANFDFENYKVWDVKEPQLQLRCNSSDPKSSTIKWFKGAKELKAESEPKSIEVSGGKLTFKRPSWDDIGNYTCAAYASVNATEPTATAEIYVVAKPYVKMVHKDVTSIEGEELKIECIVAGRPTPAVVWQFENGTLYDYSVDRILISTAVEDENRIKSTFTIEHSRLADRGYYHCIAQNIANNNPSDKEHSKASCYVRIKDKYAAVWPFLGICVEVVVLCAVIFIYEKKRNKAELEESDTDQSPEQKNTPDHGKESVRQRK